VTNRFDTQLHAGRTFRADWAVAQEAIAPRRVLVLYWTPTPPSEIRAAIRHHLEAIKQGPSSHRVTFWNAFEGSPLLLRRGDYDAVVLQTTLLCLRWFPNFAEWRRKLGWISGLDCLKIAMPQDEYDHSEILDEWLSELGVQHVFSNFGDDVRPLLYPNISRQARFQPAFTGYIDDRTARKVESRLEPSDRRPYDVVYRASHLPYWFGSLGQLKHRIGDRAQTEARSRNLTANVSTRVEDAIMGDEWFDFLGAGRAIVGCESGSSVLDRRGEMQTSIRRYLDEHPGASFEEVSAHMPEGWDSYRFAAASPRHFEAVITRTCQVLVRGRYDGVLAPDRHYVPVSPDLSNLGEALEEASDPAVASEIASRSYEEIYRSGRYSYRVLAEQIDQVLETVPPKTGGLGVAASALVARWGERQLNRPSDLDAEWAITVASTAENASPRAGTPREQLQRLMREGSGRASVAAALRGRLSRRLLREYVLSGREGAPIQASRLLAEALLLDRMARAQDVEPRTPRSRVVKASQSGEELDLNLLRLAPVPDGSAGAVGTWPPMAISVHVATFRGVANGVQPLDAVAAVAAIRPRGVGSALRPLLDSIGGARSRPHIAGGRSRAKAWIVTLRTLAARPGDAWLLANVLGRAPLRDAADDLVKLALMEKAMKASGMALELDEDGRVLRVVTTPGGERKTAAQDVSINHAARIVWDNSASGPYVPAPVISGRSLTVFVGAGGIHEFTALEMLPASARSRIFRRLIS